ncbi:MAG: ABC transporter permease [Firmicutes bacterium]|nr:ABC transporter permease [Bacillota bacterium]
MNLRRILRIAWKEIIQTLRDTRILLILFLAPVAQLFIFGYVVSTDVTHVAAAICDEDHSRASLELTDRFVKSNYFEYKYSLSGPGDIDWVMDSGRAQMVLHIPRGFGSDISRGRGTAVQVIIDGTESMTGRIINGYVNDIIGSYSQEKSLSMAEKLNIQPVKFTKIDGRFRTWYNPELKSVNFMVPGVMCVIILIATMSMTAMALVREKEIGTMEQLIVTPISPGELMIGKSLPFLLTGIIDMVFILIAAFYWFHVPIAGNILLLFLLSALFMLTSLGLGIFISTISTTQQEATIMSFFFLSPSLMLSGFIFPIENMPPVIQKITYVLPLRYFIEIVRGVFLKGIGLEILWHQALILLVFGLTILTVSAIRFKKKIS